MDSNKNINVIIRDLHIDDAKTSYLWRNDPAIWQYTKNRPTKTITIEDESNWLRKELTNTTTRRFAICAGIPQLYIGNIQITNLTPRSGQYHIFIGNRDYWGFGIAYSASKLLFDYARTVLKLEEIYLFVKHDNIRAIKLYDKLGFVRDDRTNEKYTLKL